MLRCVIFDLDGVLVSTDEYHYLAWKSIADELGVMFDRTDNLRQRGVSRMESLEVVLEKTERAFTREEKQELAQRKNERYTAYLEELGTHSVLPGVEESLRFLDEKGILLAVGSSSKNADVILERTGLAKRLPFVVTGLDIIHSKPHPEVFLKAAERAGVFAAECLVVEDAATGVEAGKAAGMLVLAVGAAKDDSRADFHAATLAEKDFSWENLIAAFKKGESA